MSRCLGDRRDRRSALQPGAGAGNDQSREHVRVPLVPCSLDPRALRSVSSWNDMKGHAEVPTECVWVL